MKKTCNNCRALVDANVGYVPKYCGLGYETEEVDRIYKDFLYTILTPLENCPKPTTVKEYRIEFEKYKKTW